MTDQQIVNKANGIARIAQAVKLCELAPVETGTIYSKRFKIILNQKEQENNYKPMKLRYDYERISDPTLSLYNNQQFI